MSIRENAMAIGMVDESSSVSPAGAVPYEGATSHAPAPRHVFTGLAGDVPITVIEPSSGWRLVNWRELYAYRDLFRFLTWRSVKVRYTQSAVGIGWAIIQPLFQMITFTLIFGRLAGLESDGVAYSAFSLVGLVAWTYYSTALINGANSLVSNAHMISKIYFPRLVLPLSDVVAKLFDFGIAMAMTLIALPFLGWAPNWGVLMIPYLVVLMMAAALGFGLWLSALAVQFRDVNHAIGFIVQLLMYASPVVYPTSLLPESYQLTSTITLAPQTLYSLNPMVGVIEGFRSALLGTRPMPYDWIALGTLTTVIALVTGALYFRNRERLFADVA
jgi:lipopolysaccharide transport system permease protein